MQTSHWSSAYVGIPYLDCGRTREGADCWGLVRLVYAEQFGIELPSFVEDYGGAGDDRIIELMAARREGWVSTDLAQPGDLVLLRVWGAVQHVGIVTEPGRFLHLRRGRTATVERLGSGIWANRVEGFYRYEARDPGSVAISGMGHPLRTVRLDGKVPAGMSLEQIQEWILAQTQTPAELGRRAVIMVDGFIVPENRWQDVRPIEGQRVEYRAVATGDTFRSVLNIGVLVGAMLLAPIIAPYFSFLGLGTALTTGLATAAVAAAGTLLVNYLFPVRPQSQKGLESPDKQNLLYGGQNQPNPYGAIPVVLGQVRYTPPLAAENYVETEGSTSYLRTALCWGYGPLQVTDIRMGDLDVNALDECTVVTVAGDAGEDLGSFNELYGTDTTQDVVNVQLVAPRWASTSWSRAVTTGLVTVTGTVDHGAQVGWAYWSPIEDRVWEITAVPTTKSLRYVSTNKTAGSGGALAGCVGPFTNQVLSGACNRITTTIHFPDGLRRVKTGGSSKVGEYDAWQFTAVVQARQLDSNTLLPLTGWGDVNERSNARVFHLPRAYFNVNSSAALERVYQWTSITVDERSNIRMRQGAPSQSSTADPSGVLLTRLQNTQTGLGSTFSRLPVIPEGEIELHRICVFGASVFSTTDLRGGAGFTVTGCGLSMSGLKATVAAGTFVRATNKIIDIGLQGQFYKADEPFTLNIDFDVPLGRWEIRVARSYYSDVDLNGYRNFGDAFLVAFTGYAPNRPVTPPAPLAMSAIRVRASNQISGTVEGFTGIVTAVCKEWDSTLGSWATRPTRNPAALFRYVLQHPANVQAVPDSGIDLVTLQGWTDYCINAGFNFDMVILEPRSILDVLRDIAAAGRASPALRDGKWTVIVDAPQSVYAQYFTPANSSGFEGARALPKIPHAFRVLYSNSEKAFQPDEMLVYADGYNAGNASLIERLELPGVTTPEAIYRHARFHLAQLKLRPETYTLNVDIEHLICQRGDLVKVTHDVAMWGLLAGRIRRLTSTRLQLSEPFEQAVGQGYTIRVRAADGTSQTAALRVAAAGELQGFLRASTATYRDSGGAIQTVAVDIPRYQDGELLLEPAATNVLLRSGDIGVTGASGWALSNITIGGTVNGPLGTNSLKKAIQALGAGGALSHYLQQVRAILTSSGQPICAYAIVKQAELNFVTLQAYCNPSNSQNLNTTFNIVAGTINSRANSAGVTRIGDGIIPLSNGAYLCWMSWTFSSGADGNILFRMFPGGIGAVVGDDTSGIYIGGVQIEQGSAPSSYIATGSVAATREADDYVPNSVVLQSSLTAGQAADGDMFMLGQTSAESVDCLVLAIEPQENMNARITLVDYAPAVYSSDTESLPAFNSQISLPPLKQRDVITKLPNLGTIRSDEATMVLLSNGQYGYRIKVSYTNPSKLPKNIKYIEGEIIEAASAAGDSRNWRPGGRQPLGAAYFFSNVQEGKAYKMRLHYVTNDGRVGKWRITGSHTVVGRALPPGQVANFALGIDGDRVVLTWDENSEIDVVGYEIRTANSGFGTAGYVARVKSTTAIVPPPAVTGSRTWYIRAFDSAENYSATSASVSLTYDRPGAPPAPTQKVNKVNANSVALELKWEDATPGTFEIAGYEIRAADSGWGTGGELYRGRAKQAVLTKVAADTQTTFYKRAYDVRGNFGLGPLTFTHDVTRPADMNGATLTVTRVKADLVMKLSGSIPAKPSDFACYEWRIGQVRAGATGGDDTPDAIVAGTTDNFWSDPDCDVLTTDGVKATIALKNFPTPRISAAGVVYRVACRMRDKSGNYSNQSALGTVTVQTIT